jgi:hypothetical protein
LLNKNYYVVSSGFTLPDTPLEDMAPGGGSEPSATDEAAVRDYFGLSPDGTYTGHGTCTASLATGNFYGVASNATLMLVKWVNGERDPSKPKEERAKLPYKLAPPRPAALADAFAFAISNYKLKKSSGSRNLKAVLNLSFGTTVTSNATPFANICRIPNLL